MTYLSEIINEKNFETWTNEKDHLLIANPGAGKTYLLLNDFVLWALQQNKTVLYFYNRKLMRSQFAEAYEKQFPNLTIKSYQAIESERSNFGNNGKTYHYILCDECQYFVTDSTFNKLTYKSFEKINENPATKIYFSATPKPFLLAESFLNKPLNTMDYSSYVSKNIQTVNIVPGEKLFYQAEEFYLSNHKIIHFQNNKEQNERLKIKYAQQGYSTEALNKDSNNAITDAINSSNNLENILCDFIATTSANETGVNFNITGNAMVTFPKFLNWASLIQSASRIRSFKNNHLSMLICIPHKKFLSTIIDINESKILEIKDQRDQLKLNESSLKYDLEILARILNIEEANEILAAKNKIEFYEEKLKSIYPLAKIKILNKHDLIDVESFFNELLKNRNQHIILKTEQQFIKSTLGIGLKIINEKLFSTNFNLTTKRLTINNKKETVWIINKK